MAEEEGKTMMIEVALVFDTSFSDRIVMLAQKMPVWIVDSPVNARVIENARSLFGEGRITTILTRIDESPANMFARALYAIDEHHGVDSQSVPYNTLWVYGASEQMMSHDLASELGFKKTTTTTEGFRADKTS